MLYQVALYRGSCVLVFCQRRTYLTQQRLNFEHLVTEILVNNSNYWLVWRTLRYAWDDKFSSACICRVLLTFYTLTRIKLCVVNLKHAWSPGCWGLNICTGKIVSSVGNFKQCRAKITGRLMRNSYTYLQIFLPKRATRLSAGFCYKVIMGDHRFMVQVIIFPRHSVHNTRAFYTCKAQNPWNTLTSIGTSNGFLYCYNFKLCKRTDTPALLALNIFNITSKIT